MTGEQERRERLYMAQYGGRAGKGAKGFPSLTVGGVRVDNVLGCSLVPVETEGPRIYCVRYIATDSSGRVIDVDGQVLINEMHGVVDEVERVT